ncbi:hypothetical protein B0H19DRAFT_655681 [Mycena capillaripes]|nr:hypothetical protein B0H19DRAFT_655681 [Mycena capillaripes]
MGCERGMGGGRGVGLRPAEREPGVSEYCAWMRLEGRRKERKKGGWMVRERTRYDKKVALSREYREEKSRTPSTSASFVGKARTAEMDSRARAAAARREDSSWILARISVRQNIETRKSLWLRQHIRTRHILRHTRQKFVYMCTRRPCTHRTLHPGTPASLTSASLSASCSSSGKDASSPRASLACAVLAPKNWTLVSVE